MQADVEEHKEPFDSARLAGMVLIIIILVIVVLAIHGKLGIASVLLILTTNLIVIKNELIRGHKKQLIAPGFHGNESGANIADVGYADDNINGMAAADTSPVGEYLGPQYEDWARHQAAMPLRGRLGQHSYSSDIDSNVVHLARRRARDRDTIHGAHRKTADYYKYFFGDELAVAENKVWWGQPDV